MSTGCWTFFTCRRPATIQCHAERQRSISISWRGANVGFFGFASE